MGWAPQNAAAAAQYVYDDGGRLVQVIAPDGSSARYGYDPAGNIIAIDRLSASTVAITSFSPSRGSSGTSVKIAGSGFSTTPSNNNVTLNGTSAVVTAASTNSVTITVPISATSGKIVVNTPNGTATSVGDFIVGTDNDSPAIATFSPTVGTAGSSVTVNGTGFQPQSVHNRAYISDTRASVTSSSSNTLVATVGAGTVTGRVKVETPFGRAVSSQIFFVPPGSYPTTDVVATGEVSSDASQSVTIAAVGKIAMYSFEGIAGQRMSIVVLSSSFSSCSVGTIRLYGPNGSQLGSANICSGGVVEPVELTTSGTYTIVVVPRSNSSGSLTFKLNAVADVTAPIAVGGSDVTLTTTTPAQNMGLTFNGSAGQRVALNVSAPSILPYLLKVFSPDGTILWSTTGTRSSEFSDLLTLPQTGIYTISTDPVGVLVGSATFTLKTVAPDVTAPIAVGGSDVTLTTTTPAQNMGLTFNGSTGQRVSLTVSGASIYPYYLKVFNPDGTILWSTTGTSSSEFSDLLTLPQTGTYTIAADPHNVKVGSATFALKTVAADVTASIAVGGSAVTLTTTTPAQNMGLTFSGSAGQRVSLSVSGASIYPYYLKIFNPDGSTLLSKTVTGSAYSSGAITLPQTGTYPIAIDPIGLKVGAATFALAIAP